MLSSVEVMKAEIQQLKNRYLGEPPEASRIKLARVKLIEREVDRMKHIIQEQIQHG